MGRMETKEVLGKVPWYGGERSLFSTPSKTVQCIHMSYLNTSCDETEKLWCNFSIPSKSA